MNMLITRTTANPTVRVRRRKNAATTRPLRGRIHDTLGAVTRFVQMHIESTRTATTYGIIRQHCWFAIIRHKETNRHRPTFAELRAHRARLVKVIATMDYVHNKLHLVLVRDGKHIV